jgi:hypothetical protein
MRTDTAFCGSCGSWSAPQPAGDDTTRPAPAPGYGPGSGPDYGSGRDYGSGNDHGYGPGNGYGSGPGLGQPHGGRPRKAVIAVGVAVLAVCAVVAAVLIMRSPSKSVSLNSGKSSASAQASATQSAAERVAAQALAGLLAQSATDHSSIANAVTNVNKCSPNLASDARVFRQAARSRQQLLAKLATLPDRSALPAQVTQQLTSAWQASQQADRDYGAWTGDQISHGCKANDTSDANYQAAAGPDNQATTAKVAFVGRWDPIATSYGLPSYQWDEL